MVILLPITSSVCSPLCNKLRGRGSAVDVSSIHGSPLLCPGSTALAHTSEKVAKLRQSCDKVCQVFKTRIFDTWIMRSSIIQENNISPTGCKIL